jgi:hypothetical protein
MTNVADSAPTTDGVKIAPMVQTELAATVFVHAGPPEPAVLLYLKSAALGPLMLGGIEIGTADVVLLVTVTYCTAVGTVTGWLPKFNGDGATVIVGVSGSSATNATDVVFVSVFSAAPDVIGNGVAPVGADEVDPAM